MSPKQTKKNKKTFLIQSDSSAKRFYTREEDETIVRMKKAGNTAKEIAEAVEHSEASIRYRMLRVLTYLKGFKEYDYDKHRITISKEELEKRRQDVLDSQAN